MFRGLRGFVLGCFVAGTLCLGTLGSCDVLRLGTFCLGMFCTHTVNTTTADGIMAAGTSNSYKNCQLLQDVRTLPQHVTEQRSAATRYSYDDI